MSNYYTPDISEFHIGFEYEYCLYPESNHIFEKSTSDWSAMDILFNDYEHEPKELIERTYRVKYLDKQDIEELGFKYDVVLSTIDVESNHFHLFYHCTQLDISYNLEYVNWYTSTVPFDSNNCTEHRIIKISRNRNDGENINTDTLFRGDIKNKSELKTLLKQLNIND